MLKIKLKYVLIFLSIVTFSKIQAQNEQVVDQLLGVVGNNAILQSAIENQYLQLMAIGYNSTNSTKCEIFEEQLFQKLLLNQAIIDSVVVNEKEVEQELTQRLEGFIKELGGVEKLEEYYRKPMAQIKDDFHDIVKDQLLAQKMQEKISGDIKVTPGEVSKFFKEFPNIQIRYEKKLHAKYYSNESAAILTSMNLYSYSQDNNIEAGVLTKSGLLGRNSPKLIADLTQLAAKSIK